MCRSHVSVLLLVSAVIVSGFTVRGMTGTSFAFRSFNNGENFKPREIYKSSVFGRLHPSTNQRISPRVPNLPKIVPSEHHPTQTFGANRIRKLPPGTVPNLKHFPKAIVPTQIDNYPRDIIDKQHQTIHNMAFHRGIIPSSYIFNDGSEGSFLPRRINSNLGFSKPMDYQYRQFDISGNNIPLPQHGSDSPDSARSPHQHFEQHPETGDPTHPSDQLEPYKARDPMGDTGDNHKDSRGPPYRGQPNQFSPSQLNHANIQLRNRPPFSRTFKPLHHPAERFGSPNEQSDLFGVPNREFPTEDKFGKNKLLRLQHDYRAEEFDNGSESKRIQDGRLHKYAKTHNSPLIPSSGALPQQLRVSAFSHQTNEPHYKSTRLVDVGKYSVETFTKFPAHSNSHEETNEFKNLIYRNLQQKRKTNRGKDTPKLYSQIYYSPANQSRAPVHNSGGEEFRSSRSKNKAIGDQFEHTYPVEGPPGFISRYETNFRHDFDHIRPIRHRKYRAR